MSPVQIIRTFQTDRPLYQTLCTLQSSVHHELNFVRRKHWVGELTCWYVEDVAICDVIRNVSDQIIAPIFLLVPVMQ
jgi:hypothetical protein